MHYIRGLDFTLDQENVHGLLQHNRKANQCRMHETTSGMHGQLTGQLPILCPLFRLGVLGFYLVDVLNYKRTI